MQLGIKSTMVMALQHLGIDANLTSDYAATDKSALERAGSSDGKERQRAQASGSPTWGC